MEEVSGVREIEVRDIVIEAKRRKILGQVKNLDPMTGNCWKWLRVLERGGGYPNAPLQDEGSFFFNEKEKSKIVAYFLIEVFSNNKDRLTRKKTNDRDKDLPDITTDRVVSMMMKRGRMNCNTG